MSNVRDFGAKGDGKTDDTRAIEHALKDGEGPLLFARGDYLVTRTIAVPLDGHGRLTIDGSGGTAKILMAGPGPAFALAGTHGKTAQPSDFQPGVWLRERMPTVRDLEIEGRHPEADGVRLEGVMQPTLTGLLIRKCRHGIHLHNRNRNVIIGDCHVYDNRGAGVFFDRVNLHQTNIHGCHISYCLQGGIKIAGSEIRNLQICSNDIEYNYDPKAETSADVFFDCRAGTVREATIVGNTIQAKASPGGANIRLVGVGQDNPNATGLLAISGNLLGSEETVIHLKACRGVVIAGNSIYSGYQNAIVAEDAEHLVIGANSIDHNPEYAGKSRDCVILRGCRHVNLSGLLLQHTRDAEVVPSASLEVRDCQNVNVVGCQIINARTRGILVTGGLVIRIADCTIRGKSGDATYRAAIDVDPSATHVMVTNNQVARGSHGGLIMNKGSGTATGNIGV
jgi:hypothetical protein